MSIKATIGLLVTGFIALASLTACGDDDSDTVALDDWVAEFDRICVEVIQEGEALTEAEFRELTEEKLAELRAFGEPEENADDAAAMLESIEKTTLDDNLTDEEIEAFDDQFLDAATSLGVSSTCVSGPQG